MNKTISRILIVEDDPKDLDVTLSALERFSAEGMVLKDGQEAWDYLFERTAESDPEFPDLIILDLGLPHRNGLEILIRMRQEERTKGIPAIILTRTPEAENVLHFFNFELYAYRMKPLNATKFIDALPKLGLKISESVLCYASVPA